MQQQFTFLVLGATGGTGKHLVPRTLADGHAVRALVRTPAKLDPRANQIDVQPGSITDRVDLDALFAGVDFVVAMLGGREAQHAKINTAFWGTGCRRAGASRW